MTQPWAPDNVSAESPHVRCPSEPLRKGTGTVCQGTILAVRGPLPYCANTLPCLRAKPKTASLLAKWTEEGQHVPGLGNWG